MITVSNNKYETKSRSEDTIMKVRGGQNRKHFLQSWKKTFWKSLSFTKIMKIRFLKIESLSHFAQYIIFYFWKCTVCNCI